MLDRSAVGQLSSLSSIEQNSSDRRQAIHYVVYRLPAIAAIWFYWIRLKVVQQLTCRPSGPAYSTGELLNTPMVLSETLALPRSRTVDYKSNDDTHAVNTRCSRCRDSCSNAYYACNAPNACHVVYILNIIFYVTVNL